MGLSQVDDMLAAELFGSGSTASKTPAAIQAARSKAVPMHVPLTYQQWVMFVASWWWLNLLALEMDVS